MSKETENFDCRTMVNNNRCQYLTPFSDGYKDEITKVSICNSLNCVVFSEFEGKGIKIKLVRVKPLFDCPMMQQKRINGQAPSIMKTIEA
jgi:hypothetical protein